MGSSAAHEQLIDNILREFGAHPQIRIWKNNTGTAYRKGRKINFGLKGSADIVGIFYTGQFLAIECKTGKSPQKPHQKSFENMITKFGGIYILARSVSDVKKGLVAQGLSTLT